MKKNFLFFFILGFLFCLPLIVRSILAITLIGFSSVLVTVNIFALLLMQIPTVILLLVGDETSTDEKLVVQQNKLNTYLVIFLMFEAILINFFVMFVSVPWPAQS